MNVPRIFGFPLWEGRIKGRVAKKRLSCWGSLGRVLKHKAKLFARSGIGDFVNDCTGFNGKIVEIHPRYVRAGRGWILIGVDLVTTNGGCSLTNCGVVPKVSREEVEASHAAFLRNWTLGEPGKNWFGTGPEGERAFERARRKLSVLEAGGHICDEDGQLLPEFGSKYL